MNLIIINPSNQIYIQYYQDKIEISHSISNEDLKRKIEIKRVKLKEKYQKDIREINLNWLFDSATCNIKINLNPLVNILTIFSNSKVSDEYTSNIHLQSNKMIIYLPADPLLKSLLGSYKAKIQTEIQDMFDIPFPQHRKKVYHFRHKRKL